MTSTRAPIPGSVDALRDIRPTARLAGATAPSRLLVQIPGFSMKPLVSAVAALLLAGCSTQLPSPVAGRDPNDPSVSVPAVRYRSVTAGTADYRPVEPKPWLDQNKGVTSRPTEGM